MKPSHSPAKPVRPVDRSTASLADTAVIVTGLAEMATERIR